MFCNFDAAAHLKRYDLRPTKPRRLIADILFADGVLRHFTADWVAAEIARRGESISTASIYNTLHIFSDKGVISEVAGSGHGPAVYDTNIEPHQHLYNEATGELTDIRIEARDILNLASQLPGDVHITGIDVIVRIDGKARGSAISQDRLVDQ